MSRIISKDEINREIRRYLNIQVHARPHLENMTDRLARKFYLDSQEISFVFEKENVLRLLGVKPSVINDENSYRNQDIRYLRVYYGAINNDFTDPNTGRRFEAGRPTIILVAAKEGSIVNTFEASIEGLEWPEGLDPNGDVVDFNIDPDAA